jgi:hypothetical protein
MVKQDGRGRGELGLAFVVDFLRHDLVVGVFAFPVVTIVCQRSYHIRLLPTQKKRGKANIEQYDGTRMDA